jgi:hypothetical protein
MATRKANGSNHLISADELRAIINKKRGAKSITQFAAQDLKGKVSYQFLAKVLVGDLWPGNKLAGLMGFEQTHAYRPASKEAKPKRAKRPPKPKAARKARAAKPKPTEEPKAHVTAAQ